MTKIFLLLYVIKMITFAYIKAYYKNDFPPLMYEVNDRILTMTCLFVCLSAYLLEEPGEPGEHPHSPRVLIPATSSPVLTPALTH